MAFFDGLSRDERSAFDGMYERFDRIPRGLVRLLGADRAVLVAFLVNWSRMRGKEQYNGWFYCPSAVISRELGFERTKQWRLLDSLSDMGYIRFNRLFGGRSNVKAPDDIKKRRWIRIDFVTLSKAVLKTVFESQVDGAELLE